MKRITLIICCALLLVLLAGCGAAKTEMIALTQEEIGILQQMGDDVNVIAEADYPSIVMELQAHPDIFSGQVYQLEGVYTTATVNDVETPYVYRTLVHDGEKTTCGLPLKYLEKELPQNAWVCVTAIINTGDFDGKSYTVMEVVSVETLAQAGQAELPWDGIGHQH